MDINTDNEKKVDAYIQDHPDCEQKGTEPVYIQDKRQNLPVYRLPTSLIFYNIRNGRFAAEYKSLVKKEGRELDSKDPDDAKKIEKLLLEENEKQTTILTEDMKRHGQKEPGIMTHDGYLINGNRRMAVLSKLSGGGNDEWGYIVVARLPKNVSEKDLWKIEAELQLSREEKLDYGPINTLLKLKEGRDHKLNDDQIAKSLYGGFTAGEIKVELDRLTLIELWLESIGHAGNYKKAERVAEHFIVLQKKISAIAESHGADIASTIQKIAFELIAKKAETKKGITQMDLRRIDKIIEDEEAKKKLFEAEAYLPAKPPEVAVEVDEKKEEENEEEDENPRTRSSKVETIYYDSIDIQKANEEKDRPLVLLTKALTNLKAIDLKGSNLKESEVKNRIKEIMGIVEKLKAFL